MRTKTLLLAAVLAALGSASSLAQVYSVNAVGYINLTIPPGFTILANQLNGTNNKLSTLLPAAAIGTTVYKWVQGSQAFDSWTSLGPGGGWLGANPEPDVNPGEACIVQTAAALPVTLVGEVPQGTLTVSLVTGYNLVSSAVPQAVDPATIGLPLADGETLYRWNNAGNNYNSYIWLAGSWFGGTAPTVNVGEGFWIQKAAAATWTRTFSVNTP